MTFPRPSGEVELEPWLSEIGHVFLEIRGHDSGCTSYGVAIDGVSWFVKVAYGDDRAQLEAARAVHGRLLHPAVVPLAAHFETLGDGSALVYPWVQGENLNDPDVPGALPRDHEASAQNRLRALSDDESQAVYDVLVDAHVAAAEAGLVAVDLYDGCLIYDFETRELHLVDIDLYSPPYTLDTDRAYGSDRLMPPEEYSRGASIGQPATVYTLARLALHLGCVRSRAQLDVALQATRADPARRYPTVAEYAVAWRDAGSGGTFWGKA